MRVERCLNEEQRTEDCRNGESESPDLSCDVDP